MDVLFNDLAIVGSGDALRSTEGSANLFFDLLSGLFIGEKEVFSGFATVSDLLAIDDIPVASLLDEAFLDTDIKEFTFFRDTFTEDDVDGAALEWRSNLVLNDFNFDGVTNNINTGFDGILPS